MIDRDTFILAREEAFLRASRRAGYTDGGGCGCGDDRECELHRKAAAVAERFCERRERR